MLLLLFPIYREDFLSSMETATKIDEIAICVSAKHAITRNASGDFSYFILILIHLCICTMQTVHGKCIYY